MVSTDASIDPELNSTTLASMTLYLLTIPHLDRDGLIDANPVRLAAQAAPLRPELRDCAGLLINEWVEVGLVQRYPGSRNQFVLFFKGFRKHNRFEYRKDRPSELPPPPGWTRTEFGLVPDDPDACFRLAQGMHIENKYRQALLANASGAGTSRSLLEGSRTILEDFSPRSDQIREDHDVDDVLSYMAPSPIAVSENTRAREAAPVDLSSLLVAYSDDQLRNVADQLGMEIGLSVQWDNWQRYLSECDRAMLFRLIGHIQRWRLATAEEFDRVRNLVGLIRRAVEENSSARLNGNQLSSLAADIERVLLLAVPEVER
jgi:hypothetical protein